MGPSCRENPMEKSPLRKNINFIENERIFPKSGSPISPSEAATRLSAAAKSGNPVMLGAPAELEALLFGFGSTIGTYLLPKDEGQTLTELRERAD